LKKKRGGTGGDTTTPRRDLDSKDKKLPPVKRAFFVVGDFKLEVTLWRSGVLSAQLQRRKEDGTWERLAKRNSVSERAVLRFLEDLRGVLLAKAELLREVCE